MSSTCFPTAALPLLAPTTQNCKDLPTFFVDNSPLFQQEYNSCQSETCQYTTVIIKLIPSIAIKCNWTTFSWKENVLPSFPFSSIAYHDFISSLVQNCFSWETSFPFWKHCLELMSLQHFPFLAAFPPALKPCGKLIALLLYSSVLMLELQILKSDWNSWKEISLSSSCWEICTWRWYAHSEPVQMSICPINCHRKEYVTAFKQSISLNRNSYYCNNCNFRVPHILFKILGKLVYSKSNCWYAQQMKPHTHCNNIAKGNVCYLHAVLIDR